MIVEEKFDAYLSKLLIPATRALRGVHPNSITWAGASVGIGSAALFLCADRTRAGACMLWLGVVGVLVHVVCDSLDGDVARMHGRTSRWGDFLDHSTDRVVDTAIVLAIGHNIAWCSDERLGWWSMLAMLFGSYFGTQAKSSGLPRDLSGFSRNERFLTLMGGATLAGVQAWTGAGVSLRMPVLGTEINGLTVVLVVCFFGGLYTSLVRTRNSYKLLQVSEG